MEYILLFFLAWMVVCLPAIIFTAVANRRRRRETAELNDRVTTLTRQLESLERRARTVAEPVPAPAASAPAPVMRITAQEAQAPPARPTAPPATAAPEREH